MLEWLTALWETLRFTILLRDVTKDIEVKPDKEIFRERSGRVPSTRTSVPVELG